MSNGSGDSVTSQGQQRDPGAVLGGRLLAWCVVAMIATAVLLWASSSVTWLRQRYRTPFSGDKTADLTGEMLRPELVPFALATLAAVAALLATGGLLRRVIGAVILLESGVLGWRLAEWWGAPTGIPVSELAQAPPRSTPLGVLHASPLGPLLMLAAALLLLSVAISVLGWAHRMPGMGAKYRNPAAAKQAPSDPDRRLWDELDEGRDPTDDRRREE